MNPSDFELLGQFYLGRLVDPGPAPSASPLLYDARDLTTHAVCVGMTGSGKTGLCVSLLEEAAIDGIPALVIDPKGDLGNLLLSFPSLDSASFEPWIDTAEAKRQGKSEGEFAASEAAKWKAGLADWGQDEARIRRLRQSAEFSIYTPGASFGRPLSMIRQVAPPAGCSDEAMRDKVASAASGLLALVKRDADPQSPEHVLLSAILDQRWRAGESVELGELIRLVMEPPMSKLGVVDIDTFIAKDARTKLAMAMNAVLASPSFAGWREGEPIDIQRLLWQGDGKPRVSIISIAHLSDAERMSFLTVLLGELVAWMRNQTGTSSLRALLYIDEIHGYVPPVANPPTKDLLLTLLKQARAFGVGTVLATQNPVDLDYKVLSNAGTWLLGRLQTEQDVERVLTGLTGAAEASGTTIDQSQLATLLAGLKKRQFLLHNVHEGAPMLFQTRWAMSYLRGPLTREQIRTLSQAPALPAAPSGDTSPTVDPSVVPAAPASESGTPELEVGVPQKFVKSALPGATRFKARIVGRAELHYVLARQDIDEWRSVACLADATSATLNEVWNDARLVQVPAWELAEPDAGDQFETISDPASAAKNYARWQKKLKTHLYRAAGISIWKCRKLKVSSTPEQSESEFQADLRQAAREKRDEKIDKIRSKYESKVMRLTDQIARAEDKVETETEQYNQRKYDTALSAGATVLGALFGKKMASVGNVGRASSTLRKAGRASKDKQDIERAKEKLATLRERLEVLEAKCKEDLQAAQELGKLENYEVTHKVLRPRKTDIDVTEVALVWLPEDFDQFKDFTNSSAPSGESKSGG